MWRSRPLPSNRRLAIESLESRCLLAVIGNNLSVGDQLQNYRIAIATTAEYTTARGGAVAALASVESLVNDLNEIFGRELAIHFELVANKEAIIFTDTATDGYNDANDLGLLLAENQEVLNSVIGVSNYDLGHVLGTTPSGSAGRAVLNSVGVDSLKGLGASVTSSISRAWLRVVAHEIGHQFGAQHTFNSSSFGNCQNQRSSGAAYEPASGSTLMSYAGSCSADNLQDEADLFFHSNSFEQIITHARGAGSPNSLSPNGGNTIPAVTAGSDHSIPAATAFQLTAVGTDADPDADLTYSWEQLDLGAAQGLPLNAADPTGPLFRTFVPVPEPTRFFPRLGDFVQGIDTAPLGEVLPTVSRPLNFRVTVRDGLGGVDSDDVLISVHDTGAPFVVTNPNTAESWTGGSEETIQWNVAGTDLSPIDADTVLIRLSIDGGRTFPIDLATTDNDGSHSVVVPNVDAQQARIMVQGKDNVFFDVSDQDVSISLDPNSPGVVISETDASTSVTEGTLIDSYQIRLTTDPNGQVTLTTTADTQTLVSVDGINFFETVDLTFSTTDAQSIYVRAIDDLIDEGAHTAQVTHAVTASTSVAYPTSTVVNSLTVLIADNEVEPLVGVDFDLVPQGESPFGWQQYQIATNTAPQVLSNLQREDGKATAFDLTLQYDASNLSGGLSSRSGTDAPNSTTVPFHLPSIESIDGFNSTNAQILATWNDLNPNKTYGVYVMAFGSESIQRVTISGDSVLPDFTQTLSDDNLIINDQTGAGDQRLNGYEKTLMPDGDGSISIRIFPIQGNAFVSGLAIREIPSTNPGINVIRSQNGTQVSEAGGFDTYQVGLNSDPFGEVAITVDADANTEISLDGVNFARSQTWQAVNTLLRTVTVRAIDDQWVEGPHTATLHHLITQSLSSDYPVTLSLDSLQVPIEDNDSFLPAIGIDFGNSGDTPANWREVGFAFNTTVSNLTFEDGSPSEVDATIVSSGSISLITDPNPDVVPEHVPSLVALGGNLAASEKITATWNDLVPNTTYNAYVFGRGQSFWPVRNQVTISGQGADQSFLQDGTGKTGVLFVNAGEAEPGRSLESYAVPVVSDANGSIGFEAKIPAPGSNRVTLAGFAIQQAPPPPTGITIDVGDGVLLSENGTNDSFHISLDIPPTAPVEITITADENSELSLDGNSFGSRQTVTMTDSTAAQIIVRAVDDAAKEGTHTSRILSQVSGEVTDSGYPASTFIESVTAVIEDNDVAAPAVESILINDGETQRSALTSLEVTFNQIVNVNDSVADPFVFTRKSDNRDVKDNPRIDHATGKTIVRFTFDPLDDLVTNFGSLVDGDYKLVIKAARISSFGLLLDGNQDGVEGDDYAFGEATRDDFFRKYGDQNGNRSVDLNDFALFRSAFGRSSGESGYLESLDSNGNQSIDLSDFSKFRSNFGT